MDEQGLMELRKKIDRMKAVNAELKGRRKQILEQMGEFGCKEIDEAEEELKALHTKLDELTMQVEQGINQIEEEYGI